VTYTRRCIETTDSPDDEHEVARNIQRNKKSTRKKELCVQLVIYQKSQSLFYAFSQNLRKLTISFVMSVCPSAWTFTPWNNSVPTAAELFHGVENQATCTFMVTRTLAPYWISTTPKYLENVAEISLLPVM
jgi:hypothetical protein